MPVVLIEAPAGLSLARKKVLVKQINASLSEAYSIDENFVFIREHSRECVGIGGVLLAAKSSSPAPTSPSLSNASPS